MSVYSMLGVKKKGAKPGDLLTAANAVNTAGAKFSFVQRMKVARAKKSAGGGKKVKGTIPKTKKGKAQVALLGRKKKTGGFAKIAASAGKKYGSAEAGKKVAGAIFQKMARAHAGK